MFANVTYDQVTHNPGGECCCKVDSCPCRDAASGGTGPGSGMTTEDEEPNTKNNVTVIGLIVGVLLAALVLGGVAWIMRGQARSKKRDEQLRTLLLDKLGA